VPDPLHAEPFHADGAAGGPGAAVLLVHGFTSTPASMTPWAEHLAGAGFRVSVPVLPGHGTVWQDLNRTGWQDWYAEVDRAFLELRRHGEPVFVAGLSMGGGLALRLAEERPDEVAGLMLVNPSVLDPDKRLLATPLLKHLTGSVAGIKSDIKKPGAGEEGYDRLPLKALDSLRELWRKTRADLRRVTAPVVVFRSAVDHVVPSISSQVVLQEVGSADVSERVLDESYHVAVLDNDATQIFTEAEAFVRRVLAADVGAGDAL
jgi:carboxylesterase